MYATVFCSPGVAGPRPSKASEDRVFTSRERRAGSAVTSAMAVESNCPARPRTSAERAVGICMFGFRRVVLIRVVYICMAYPRQPFFGLLLVLSSTISFAATCEKHDVTITRDDWGIAHV